MKAKPPPLPPAWPRRTHSPPPFAAPKRPESGTFTLESKTPPRAKDMAAFQSLLSVFDELTDEERLEFIEFGFVFKSLPRDARKRLLELAIAEVFP
ncbi:MAG TPA: hypothetical protein VGK73_33305 [Polyangiaceae bacterium]